MTIVNPIEMKETRRLLRNVSLEKKLYIQVKQRQRLFMTVLLNDINLYKWRRCLKKKCCKQCGQVKFMGTMTKWPVQKHTEHHKTRSKQGRNRHKETTIFCVFRFFCFLFSIFNYLKDFSRKC